MQKLKKILFLLLTNLVIISCASLNSQQYFNKGEYLKSLEVISAEIPKAKSVEDKTILVNRIHSIVRIYEDNYNNAMGSFAKSKTSFEMFKLLSLIEKYPILLQNTDVSHKYNAVDMLNSSIENIKDYSNVNDTMQPLEELLIRMDRGDILKTRFASMYQNFARYIADKYYFIASNEERKGNLEEARDNYVKVYESYRQFESNYRNSYSKYKELNKVIELKKADEYIIKANNNNALGYTEIALDEYKKAVSIYEKYNIYDKVRTYKNVIQRIERDVDLRKANDYFNRALNNYNLNNLDRAKDEFNLAKDIYVKYSVRDRINQIKVYLENIEFKVKEEKGNKYFNDAILYYQNGNYTASRDLLLKAREIYQVFNNSSKIREIDVYLEAIKSRLNYPNTNYDTKRGIELYNTAKKEAEFASRERNSLRAREYFISALNKFEEIKKYNLLPNKIDDVNRYINYINRMLNSWQNIY